MAAFWRKLWSGVIVWTPCVSTPEYYLEPAWKVARVNGRAPT